jgi:hypothetical protein
VIQISGGGGRWRATAPDALPDVQSFASGFCEGPGRFAIAFSNRSNRRLNMRFFLSFGVDFNAMSIDSVADVYAVGQGNQHKGLFSGASGTDY